MARIDNKSEEKVLLDSLSFQTLKPTYEKNLNYLIRKYSVEYDNSFKELVNFKKNSLIPKHSWFEYKQGYSHQLVRNLIIHENPPENLHILDPFCGVGTTNLVAQELGYRSVGYDVNPVATLVARSKTSIFIAKEIESLENIIKNISFDKAFERPKLKLLIGAYEDKDLKILMQIRGFIESLDNQKFKDFFMTAFLSIVEECSNRKKDGNGIKIIKKPRSKLNIKSLYISILKRMIVDIKNHKNEDQALIYQDTFLNNQLEDCSVGLTITSPPYANCFDYCEVYKLELWMGGFVREYRDFDMYRNTAIRSHVNSKFSHQIANEINFVEVITQCISCFNVWNKNIPIMIKGYFDDMYEVIKEIFRVSVQGAKFYIVVANSCYKNILVPTDLILADIASQLGFKVKKIIKARNLRASSQQMIEVNNNFKELLRESIIILEK